jgi:hypothetical protein
MDVPVRQLLRDGQECPSYKTVKNLCAGAYMAGCGYRQLLWSPTSILFTKAPARQDVQGRCDRPKNPNKAWRSRMGSNTASR